MQRQVWLIPLADETQGVQVKLRYPLTMRAILERLRDASCGGVVQVDFTFTFTFTAIERSPNDDSVRGTAMTVLDSADLKSALYRGLLLWYLYQRLWLQLRYDCDTRYDHSTAYVTTRLLHCGLNKKKYRSA